jgi:hypothetical protein
VDGNEFAKALIDALDARLSRRGEMTLTEGGLKALLREALDPQAAKAFERPPAPPQLPGPPPDFPKLKVKYQMGRPVEHVICATIFEEVPFMAGGWYTRPLSELEQIRRELGCETT